MSRDDPLSSAVRLRTGCVGGGALAVVRCSGSLGWAPAAGAPEALRALERKRGAARATESPSIERQESTSVLRRATENGLSQVTSVQSVQKGEPKERAGAATCAFHFSAPAGRYPLSRFLSASHAFGERIGRRGCIHTCVGRTLSLDAAWHTPRVTLAFPKYRPG